MRLIGDGITQQLHLVPDDVALDVASGTGKPGLTIAGMLSGGKVVSIDIAEDMLAVARENATRCGLHLFETQVADVCELPFPTKC